MIHNEQILTTDDIRRTYEHLLGSVRPSRFSDLNVTSIGEETPIGYALTDSDAYGYVNISVTSSPLPSCEFQTSDIEYLSRIDNIEHLNIENKDNLIYRVNVLRRKLRKSEFLTGGAL